MIYSKLLIRNSRKSKTKRKSDFELEKKKKAGVSFILLSPFTSFPRKPATKKESAEKNSEK